MSHRRTAGLLLHPTSLPGSGGIGTLGPDAHRFLDVLADSGCTIWQMLPLGPTGYGDSPYQSFSTFAGNPLLIHIAGDDESADPHPTRVDYERVIAHRKLKLSVEVDRFVPNDQYRGFIQANQHWLGDYAHFMALKDLRGGSPWTEWGADAMHRDAPASAASDELRERVHQRQVEQFLFDQQFRSLRTAAAARGITLMGDLPIYVARDSADVWSHRELFQLTPDGTPRVQAGVPPDYFSSSGQLWGNPIFDWDRHAATGYAWWIERVRHALTRFDLLRLDHFRGFESYWEVPGDATTAVDGRWVTGPGQGFFDAIAKAVGTGRIVAEDLGDITPAVEALRDTCGLPGMAVLQFAFGDPDPANVHLPHNWQRHLVAYTGTHDNDTAAGWWNSLGSDSAPLSSANASSKPLVSDPKGEAMAYLQPGDAPIHEAMIRAVVGSVADTAIIPLQDVLGLGSEARMNHPGRTEGNWTWRFTWNQIVHDDISWLRKMVSLFGRLHESPRDEASRSTSGRIR